MTRSTFEEDSAVNNTEFLKYICCLEEIEEEYYFSQTLEDYFSLNLDGYWSKEYEMYSRSKIILYYNDGWKL